MFLQQSYQEKRETAIREHINRDLYESEYRAGHQDLLRKMFKESLKLPMSGSVPRFPACWWLFVGSLSIKEVASTWSAVRWHGRMEWVDPAPDEEGGHCEGSENAIMLASFAVNQPVGFHKNAFFAPRPFSPSLPLSRGPIEAVVGKPGPPLVFRSASAPCSSSASRMPEHVFLLTLRSSAPLRRSWRGEEEETEPRTKPDGGWARLLDSLF